MSNDAKRELLRHLIATIAFRGRIAITDPPNGFADLRVVPDARSPVEILAHIGDLLTGSHFLLRGEFVSLASDPLPWHEETERFISSARELDAFLAAETNLAHPVEKFVQGPIGDALTHVGQIVMLRRIAGSPVREEPYFTAHIVPGEF